jgi:alkylation response protein AidB-like acyl-CoA dehydrogenase
VSVADIRPGHASHRRHFSFNDEHEQLRESIRRFVTAEVLPHAEEWEQTTFPNSIVRSMGELGFLGLDKPVECGGQGGDHYSSLVLAEELARGRSGGLTMGIAVQTDMTLPPTAQDVFERTLGYAKERVAFGRPIGSFQANRHKFAEMATKIETARQLVYTTAWRFQNGEYPVREIAMAKLHSARIAVEVADDCIQIHGGAGYMLEYGIEHAWRDLRLNRIGAGTDEVMLEVIGRSYGL